MAAYTELRGLYTDNELINKIEVAIAIAANKIASGLDTDSSVFDQAPPAHDRRVKWSANALLNTQSQALLVAKMVLAKNSAATVNQIMGASDASIQTNVEQSIDLLATAFYS